MRGALERPGRRRPAAVAVAGMTRRDLLRGLGALGAGCVAGGRRGPAGPERAAVTIALWTNGAGGLRDVQLGLPLPPGFLDAAERVRVLDARGRELEVHAAALEPWRAGAAAGAAGSIRSVRIQLRCALAGVGPELLSVRFDGRGRGRGPLFAVEDTLVAREGGVEPAVLALLPPAWMCASGVAGPQVAVGGAGPLASYDRLVERSFPGSLAFARSETAAHWLFDRTSTWYKQYVRTGQRRYLRAAHAAAHFVRAHTRAEGPDAGIFTLKGVDGKYIYPQAMHLHYLLTGDARFRETAVQMARFHRDRWDPWYRPEQYAPVSPEVDPEKDRRFWTPRHEAYGLLGVVHGWELTGDASFARRAREYGDALAAHQARPPDGRPPDGSWRQDWALYDPSESRLPGATSAWMTAILGAALFAYWLAFDDARVPGMIVGVCDFLDRRAFRPDGRVYYVVDCLGAESVIDSPGTGPGDPGTERHALELAYLFAMGIFFSARGAEGAALRARFRRRFDALYAQAQALDLNRPPRAYNWAFHASSQLLYFLLR